MRRSWSPAVTSGAGSESGSKGGPSSAIDIARLPPSRCSDTSTRAAPAGAPCMTTFMKTSSSASSKGSDPSAGSAAADQNSLRKAVSTASCAASLLTAKRRSLPIGSFRGRDLGERRRPVRMDRDHAAEAAQLEDLAHCRLQRAECEDHSGTLRSACGLQESPQSCARDVVERGTIDNHRFGFTGMRGRHGLLELLLKGRSRAEIEPPLRNHQRRARDLLEAHLHRGSQPSTVSVMSSDCPALPENSLTLAQMRSMSGAAASSPPARSCAISRSGP